MAKESIQQALKNGDPTLDPGEIHRFVTSIDPAYFDRVGPRRAARHLRLLSGLQEGHLVRLEFSEEGPERLGLAVIGFDYPSEFGLLCGLLAGFGLDIVSGAIFTLSTEKAAPPTGRKSRLAFRSPHRKKILDLFELRTLAGVRFGPEERRKFAEELGELVRLLDKGNLEEARERVNRRIIECFSEIKASLSGLLFPVEITFDNASSERWTLLEIRTKDTPAFLFALANALALRGVDIQSVLIRTEGEEVYDRLSISDARGRKIVEPREQELLKTAVALIKQFTAFLVAAPDPAKAIRSFDHLLDKLFAARRKVSTPPFLKKPETLTMLARLLGTSDFLWEDFLRMQFENLLPVLGKPGSAKRRGKRAMAGDLSRRLAAARPAPRKKAVLNEFKDREMFRIDLAHLGRPREALVEFSRELTDLADVVLEAGLALGRANLARTVGNPKLPKGKASRCAIFGLGKYGGIEMGYASDIEIIVVYDGPGRTDGRESIVHSEYYDRLVREIIGAMEAKQEAIFQIDLRLRPHGESGPLAIPLDQFRAYYSAPGGAAPFERQALTKMRWVAGDRALGRRVTAHRDRFVYSGAPWDLKTALHLRRRQMAELVRPGALNVKYSAGGVIDIEYAVQYLQVMHGHRHQKIRKSSTLDALEGLRKVGLIRRSEHTRLREAYLFLRALIDGLRIVRGHAKDLELPDTASKDFRFLARRMGVQAADWSQAAKRLEEELHTRMADSHKFFADRFGSASDDPAGSVQNSRLLGGGE